MQANADSLEALSRDIRRAGAICRLVASAKDTSEDERFAALEGVVALLERSAEEAAQMALGTIRVRREGRLTTR